jgi:hypothetical protein
LLDRLVKNAEDYSNIIGKEMERLLLATEGGDTITITQEMEKRRIMRISSASK